MDACLLYRDSSTDGRKGYDFRQDMIKDFNLDILFRTMARDDFLISEKVRKVVLIPLTSPEEILYRQEVLQELYHFSRLTEEMYECARRQEKALQKYKEERERFYSRSTRKTGEILETLAFLARGQEELTGLKKLLEEYDGRLQSEGMINLLARMREQPLEEIGTKLKEMEFFISSGEIGCTVQFGGGMKMDRLQINYCTTEKRQGGQSSLRGIQKFYNKLVRKNTIPIHSNVVLREEVAHLKETAMEQMLKRFRLYLGEMITFFEHFIEETAFYVGVIQFMKRMKEIGIPLTMPEPRPEGSGDTRFENLFELSMAVYLQTIPVGNDLTMRDNVLTLVTGANQGGKSTFLRSYGIAQVLMQCGMPVPAARFSAPVYRHIFTHFTRRESEKMDSGRLQEELKRMSGMICAAGPGSLFLLNESFASTTEKEGTRIAGAILRAFYEKGIKTMMVTHLYQLAHELYHENLPGVLFLTAERQEDGTRTYKMVPGEPSHTSYGTDLFRLLEDELASEGLEIFT